MADMQVEAIGRPIGSDPAVMGGQLVVQGTRVPAETILAYIGGGATDAEILEDYPSLFVEDIRSVEAWARNRPA